MENIIDIRCAGGHGQTLRVDGLLGRKYAETLCGLLDGTSPMFVFPPNDSSPIGKCGICGAKIKAEVIS